MLYLEDYLELIEHLPQELRDRLTLIRENDLKVNNSSLHRDIKVKQFFAEAKELSPEEKQCSYEDILKDYEETQKYADEKVQIAAQTHDIMVKLIQKLDGELEKFKLELEADHAGITEELERRSLELDADTRLDEAINCHLNNSSSSVVRHSSNFKDRRRSEHKQHQRHHPYQNNHHNNGYHVRAKLSQNHSGPVDPYSTSSHKQMPQYKHTNGQGVGKVAHHNVKNVSRQNSNATSPIPHRAGSASIELAGDRMLNSTEISEGHYTSNLASFGNNSAFDTSFKNNLQHSALSAALSSNSTHLPQTISVHINKISNNDSHLKGPDLTDSHSPLVSQNPLAAAASQAIAATQQLQQGRRTPSLKASFAAINAANLSNQLNDFCHNNKQDGLLGLVNRNALAPMSNDQQAFTYNQPYGKTDSNGNSSPLYVSITKSGRPSKRPKHHASHIYPDESPTSISSDNSVFENSESISSAELFDNSHVFGSASPSSLDYNVSRVSDQDSTFYQQRDDTRYCICRQISYGGMVACDNNECEIEWFHYGCVGIIKAPEGKWYCPDCSKRMGSQHINGRAQPQQLKKRGRKEKSVFNTLQCVPKSHKVKALDF